MADSLPSPDEKSPPRRSFFIVRWLRGFRRSLEDDGVIGRVISSAFYTTLTNLRFMFLMLKPILWGLEYYLGKYTLNPLDRMRKEVFKKKGVYGPLGQALNSVAEKRLERVLALWWGIEVLLAVVYVFLEFFTLEEYEVAQREYEEAKRALGADIGEEEEDDKKKSLPTRIADSRAFRYLSRAVMFYQAISMAGTVGFAAYDGVMSAHRDANAPPVDLSRVNPYQRKLPLAQEGVLREMLYMGHVLHDLYPSTLPEDDLDLYSSMLHNLATRKDLSWRIYEESDIRSTVLLVAGRTPITKESIPLYTRASELFKHWDALAILPDKPERWDLASDTTFIKPLLHGQSIAGDDKTAFEDGGHELVLTPEQSEVADQVYQKWRKHYNHEASYLRDHPPTPIGWVQVAKTAQGKSNAWSSLFDDGIFKEGSVPVGKVAASKLWKPIYGHFNNVPWGWLAPGVTKEQRQEDLKQSIAFSRAMEARRQARDERAAELRAEMKRESEEGHGKTEL